ncbi:MAG: hypothetical protein EXQ56_06415 [Acidobacteria bacterium]|nr:hypothetical protein [Acidobacteriota bacterium]
MDLVGALKDLFISAVPTFMLVWILYAYVSQVFYRPMRKALDDRHSATTGLRKKADEQIALVEKKTSDYEDALRANRGELARHQEEQRTAAMKQRATIIQLARDSAQQKMTRARAEIVQETAEAKKSLERQSEEMALWITNAVLNPPSSFSGNRLTAKGGTS